GEFTECERIAQRLIAEGGDRAAKVAGLHAIARALAGPGRHVDAYRYAKAAAELTPDGELGAELAATMNRIVAQQAPPVRPRVEHTPEGQAHDAALTGRPDWAIGVGR